MSQPAAKWALCNLSLIVWGFGAFCFPVRLLVRRWKSKWYGGHNNALQITSAMQMSAFNENHEFLLSQISMADDNQSIHASALRSYMHCVAAAELGLFQTPSASIHLNKLSSAFSLPLSPPLWGIKDTEKGEALTLMSLSVWALSMPCVRHQREQQKYSKPKGQAGRENKVDGKDGVSTMLRDMSESSSTAVLLCFGALKRWIYPSRWRWITS